MKLGRRMMVGFSLVGALGFSAVAASALDFHLALSKAVPAADATVAVAPATIDLFFTQAPQVRASGLSLTLMGGDEVDVERVTADADDGKILHAKVAGEMAPGMYHVEWRAMAQDGHVVTGNYHFTLRPASSD